MKEIQELIADAFLLGFMVSREGFNGEVAVECHGPDALKPHDGKIADFEQSMRGNERFKKLQAEAVDFFSNREVVREHEG